MSSHYKLIFFTPPGDLPKPKAAVLATGAGSYPRPGGYTEVCFTTPGIGQFKPGISAKPHTGTHGQVEEVGEVKYEIFCKGKDIVRAAVKALVDAHPYEEVAYEVYKMEDF